MDILEIWCMDKPNFQEDLREVARVVTHSDNAFIPCKDKLGRETYINTDEVECVTEYKLGDN
ncbi:hypothetical protein M4L39_06790 [Staphylococcus equorum]|uniref:hypothetical protein n=1 Tax=Staphylococcus equorum TaxID=246432 RepID=UPI0024078CB4|nr:hypothetical protein [Staphylococcus equorum]MDG0843144.1 hypothetical protein [Staphylococcus equorum]